MKSGRTVSCSFVLSLAMIVAGASANTAARPAAHGASRTPRAHPVAKALKPPLTPETYAGQVAQINSCTQFIEDIWAIDEPTALLQHIFDGSIADKSEFETKEAYNQRLSKGLMKTLGDPTRIYSVIEVPASYSTYDAETGIMNIDFPSYYKSTIPYSATLSSYDNQTATSMGSNAFGVKVMIKTYRGKELRGKFSFPDGSLPSHLSVSMTPAEAKAFKNNEGWMHVLSMLDGYSTDYSHAGATIDDPIEVSRSYKDVTLVPRCAVMSIGTKVVAGWTLDNFELK